MSESSDDPERGRRRVVMQMPASVAAFAGAAGLSTDEVIQELAKMGIHARGDFLLPERIVQAVGIEHGIEVEFRSRRDA